MYRFLEMVGFILWEPVSKYASTKSYATGVGWKYVSAYQRGERLSWIEQSGMAGAVETHPRRGLTNMTGYDVCAFIRAWLVQEGFAQLSVCDVILCDDRFVELRKCVGLANVFWSHVQREGLVGTQNSTLSSIGAACVKQLGVDPFDFDAQGLFFWVDYFVLRQAQSGDFNAAAVVVLIKDINRVVACIDKEMNYVKRSFRILELYAAVAAPNAQLICHSKRNRSGIGQCLNDSPPNSCDASTRDIEDKNVIDDYIRSSIGFSAMDEVVTSSILAGATCAKHLRVRCPQCYPGEAASPSGGY